MMFGFLTVDLNYLVNRASRSFHVAGTAGPKAKFAISGNPPGLYQSGCIGMCCK
jgi:hypothetical protein